MPSQTPKFQALLWAEFLAFFVLIPTLFIFHLLPHRLIYPFFFFGAVYAVVFLYHQKASIFVKFSPKFLAFIFIRFLIFGALMSVFAYFYHKGSFLNLPRNYPKFWLILLIIYPLVSAFMQEVIYRQFFCARYAPIFGAFLGFASVMAFAYLHLIYVGYLAFCFTLVGGYFFYTTYRHSGSVLLAAIEHGLYGDLVFTLGLGRYFYSLY